MPTNKQGYMNKYYINNKNKFLDKIECDVCKKKVAKTSMSRHLVSNYHKKRQNVKDNFNDFNKIIYLEKTDKNGNIEKIRITEDYLNDLDNLDNLGN